MERDLITKIKDLIDNEPGLEDANWFINILNEYLPSSKSTALGVNKFV